MSVFSRSASRVPQATLVLSLSLLLPLLPSANAAPTSVPSSYTTSQQLNRRTEEPTSASKSGLSVPVLLTLVTVSLFFVILGATLAYMHVRRRRVSQKRAEHRERTAQFQEMHRAGARPYFAGSAPSVATVDLNKEMMGPRYPIKAYVN